MKNYIILSVLMIFSTLAFAQNSESPRPAPDKTQAPADSTVRLPESTTTSVSEPIDKLPLFTYHNGVIQQVKQPGGQAEDPCILVVYSMTGQVIDTFDGVLPGTSLQVSQPESMVIIQARNLRTLKIHTQKLIQF